jgi:hypothetical protein
MVCCHDADVTVPGRPNLTRNTTPGPSLSLLQVQVVRVDPDANSRGRPAGPGPAAPHDTVTQASSSRQTSSCVFTVT